MHVVSKRVLVVLCLIAVLGGYLRVVAMAETVIERPIRADAAEYYVSAYNLAKHGVYGRSTAALRNPPEAPVSDSYRWPGLPLVIAAFMGQWPNHVAILRDVQWVNAVTGTATILLVGLAAASALPAWAAVAAALLTAVSPHLISFGVYLLTEPPATFLIALMLWLCALGPAPSAERRSALAWAAAIGIAVGLTALFRPIFLLFPLFLAVALVAFRDRKALILALAIGTALPVAPWMVRNAISVALVAGTSPLGRALVAGSYPGYVFNGDLRTFPYAYEYDPRAKAAYASVPSALAEVGNRVAADPVAMAKWYLLGKQRYLWQFDNVDGVGGVFIYPVRQSPFQSHPLFVAIHNLMRVLHWPIVLLAALGAALVWLPWSKRYLPESGNLVVRTGSLLLAFVTVAHFPLWEATRFAVPVFPALFLMATVPIIIVTRCIKI